ncbi:MAG: hypothetical protein IKW62_01550 [Clostridia bacterium]|nr:hypothetical protein [Clostridia bacterium]
MKISKRQYEYLLFLAMVVLAVFRFSYFNLKYIPYLDDYVQYYYYPQLENAWQRVYWGGAGALFTRPLAGLFDFVLWSRFWGSPGLAVGIISVLHGLSGVLFYKAFNICKLKLSPLFLVLYILIPINIEGTYWLSASSRIVVSMFFIALGAFFGAKKKTGAFFIFSFLSVWFYEQTAILGVFVLTWICVLQKEKWKSILPIFSALVLAIFYLKLGGQGDNAHRLGVATLPDMWNNIKATLNSFLKVATEIQFRILSKGFVRGFTQIALDFSLGWLAFAIILSMFFFNFSEHIGHKGKIQKSGIVAGVIFMIVPLVPFLVAKGSFFNLRNMVPCTLGIAILLDKLIACISKKHVYAVGAILIFWFSVSAVSEVRDYAFVAERDMALAAELSKKITMDTSLVKVEVKTPDYYPQNAPYRDHIMSMTGSDWGVTGIVRALSKNEKVVVELIK